MSKLAVQIAIVGILIAVAATINITGVHASEGAEILQISVRAQSRANYAVDTDLGTIPAISIDIVEDKINDQASARSNPLVAPLPTTDPLLDSPEPQASPETPPRWGQKHSAHQGQQACEWRDQPGPGSTRT